MPRACLVAAFLVPVIGLALPDDAILSRLLVGRLEVRARRPSIQGFLAKVTR